MIAYALRGVIFLLPTLMIVLMVCGLLYTREHLAPAPDSKLPDGNMGTGDSSLSEPPIVPIEPAIPGEITIRDWIVQDILPVNEYSRPGIALSEINGIAVHYTGNPGTTAEQNRGYYKNLAETKEMYASSHFIFGMGGKLFNALPWMKLHPAPIIRNDDTISIECCHSDDTGQFSQDTLYQSNKITVNNMRTHHVKEVQTLLQVAGMKLLYLPAYSPDLNPIENMWSKIKAILRKLKIRLLPQLPHGIAQAFSLIRSFNTSGSDKGVPAWIHACSSSVWISWLCR